MSNFQGIFFHERAYGNFFCPEDQKSSRNDSLDHETVDVCPETSYEGLVILVPKLGPLKVA